MLIWPARHAFPPSLWEIAYGVFWTLVPPGSASFFWDREGAMQETKDDKKPESAPHKQSMGERLTERLQQQQDKNQAGCKQLSRSCIGNASRALCGRSSNKEPRHH